MPPRPDSPRYQAVLRCVAELRELAAEAGVELALCGSVARGTDSDDGHIPSDIDLLCLTFRDPDASDAHRRTFLLERTAKELLAPYRADVIGTQLLPADAEYRARMLEDAIRLEDLT